MATSELNQTQSNEKGSRRSVPGDTVNWLVEYDGHTMNFLRQVKAPGWELGEAAVRNFLALPEALASQSNEHRVQSARMFEAK